jgi:hypothetical protein
MDLTKANDIHIGQLIQEQLKKDQRSVGWLSRQIPCTRNHVYKLFKRSSLDAELLLHISIVMQFNFFQYYTAEFINGMKDRVGENQTQIADAFP